VGSADGTRGRTGACPRDETVPKTLLGFEILDAYTATTKSDWGKLGSDTSCARRARRRAVCSCPSRWLTRYATLNDLLDAKRVVVAMVALRGFSETDEGSLPYIIN